MQTAEQIAAGLTSVQRARLASVDPHNVSRYHYAPFKGQSLGLFQIAPGWSRMELSPFGHRIRNELIEQQARAEGRKTFGPKLDAHCPYDEMTLRVDLQQGGGVAICPCCWTTFAKIDEAGGAA